MVKRTNSNSSKDMRNGLIMLGVAFVLGFVIGFLI